MDDSRKNFSVWLFRPRHWSAGDAGRKVGGGFQEPAEAADFAEQKLNSTGVEGQSYCELRFNGETKPHTVICYLRKDEFGIWNTDHARWPIFYPPEMDSLMLGDFPFPDAEDGNSWAEVDESDSKEKSDEGNMRLDEIQEDDTDEADEEAEEDDESEEDSGEDAEDDQSDDDDEFDGDDDEEDSDDSDEGEDSEEDDQGNSDLDDEGEEEEEKEMPRLKIFGKFKGPLGWRKRAEAEELQETNVFALRLGILDEEGERPRDQERELFATVEFRESDEDREAGILRFKLPTLDITEDGLELKREKGGWLQIRVPYRGEEV